MSVHRFTASWTVDTGPHPDSDFKLLPIAPRRLAEVFGAVVRKLLDVAGELDVRVGAVSVTCQPEPGGGYDPASGDGAAVRSTPAAGNDPS